ncbi:somatomedin-B and thrombospondin type-1 domain-containing protein-like isoform X2 [Motacilla alba alba]|uniref:somatomedin-B and thrombospondin type-1 domain-containing protein-like isoform X2 n=1 Tax=Motacilla alba alba TaxID=1094192 RepID=UPI0018D4E688|nr:somatomedin-B and thrombospondin type-1 domain-containing protein-like isoform X2 [Motacilla alba alba]
MGGRRRWLPALPLLLLLLLPLPPPGLPRRPSGCAARGLCCPGRDRGCLSAGRRPDGSSGPCYCDQACARTLDCCHDYAQACPVIPCVVSQWSAWSGCAEPCKTTYRVRTRHIVQEPRNGGEACPALEQRAGCVEYWTRQGAECQQSLIPALITTGGFGKARKKRAAAGGSERAGCALPCSPAQACPVFELTWPLVAGTAWSSSWWPWRRAACSASRRTGAGCARSGRDARSAWSASTQPCSRPRSTATGTAPAAS